MPSHIDWIRAFCLSLPHATEDIQWENNLLFRIAKKMFCIVSLEPATRVKFCFKCTPEKFAELVEIEGVIPAPYMARNHWVGIVELSALRQPEIKDLIQNSYQMVFEKLPKGLQAEMSTQDFTNKKALGAREKRKVAEVSRKKSRSR